MSVIAWAVAAYLLLQLFIGVWAAHFVRSEDDYLVAGRSLGLPLVAMSLFATWFGAETVMGSSAAIAKEGLAGGRADPFGYALCLLGMGLLLAYQLRKRNYLTIGDFFRDRYSPAVETLGSVLFTPSVVMWAAAQLLAFGHIVSLLTGMPLDVTLIVATVVVIAYTVLGGLLGDVVTDLVQGVVLIIGLVILLAAVFAAAGGAEAAFARIEARQLSFVGEGESLWTRIDVWAVPIIGSLVSQAALARLLAAKSPETARRACFAAFGLYLGVGMIPVLIALVGVHLGHELGEGDHFLPSLAQALLPPWLLVIFLGALVSAILSTVDSTLLTVAALWSHNIILPRLPQADERFKVMLARGLVVVAGIAAYLIASMATRILDLVILADATLGGFVVVVLAGLYGRGFGGAWAALAALVTGIGAFAFGSLAVTMQAPFVFSLVMSLLAYCGVALMERRAARG